MTEKLYVVNDQSGYSKALFYVKQTKRLTTMRVVYGFDKNKYISARAVTEDGDDPERGVWRCLKQLDSKKEWLHDLQFQIDPYVFNALKIAGAYHVVELKILS